MRELEERSGMSRTAIHHYLREGLLPAPDKTAANAALYTPAHLERLDLIRELRSEQLGPHSLPTIKRILARIDAGTTPGAAISLEQMVAGDASDSGPFNAEGLAQAAGVGASVIQDLINVGLLIDGESSQAFDESDLAAVRVCVKLFDTTPLRSTDLTPIVELIGEIVRYEQSLTELVSSVETAAGRDPRSLERALDVLHAYIFATRAQK